MARQHSVPATSHLRRLGWMLALWMLGVLSLAIVALLLRLVMNLTGLTT